MKTVKVWWQLVWSDDRLGLRIHGDEFWSLINGDREMLWIKAKRRAEALQWCEQIDG